ncbi:MAG: PspA/IM30 family protein [Methylophagaceae bacterium]
MALITRLSRLFHADMNAVLDSIEEPELLLKQALREMEETLISDERQIKLLDFEQQQLSKKRDDIKQSLVELEQQLSLCFESNKDDLARTLIKRKLEVQHYLKILTNQSSTSDDTISQLRSQLKEHQSQLSSMKQKADIFKQNTSTDTATASWDSQSFVVQDEDIEVAFLHEKQQWSAS